jgi:hypothetical protein
VGKIFVIVRSSRLPQESVLLGWCNSRQLPGVLLCPMSAALYHCTVVGTVLVLQTFRFWHVLKSGQDDGQHPEQESCLLMPLVTNHEWDGMFGRLRLQWEGNIRKEGVEVWTGFTWFSLQEWTFVNTAMNLQVLYETQNILASSVTNSLSRENLLWFC